MTRTHRVVANRLLERSPLKERARFIAACEPAYLSIGEVLARPGQPVRHVHFPTGGIISLIAPMGGHDALEVDLVGAEGVHGMPLVLGAKLSTMLAEVQRAGSALRMEAGAFQRDLAQFPALHATLDLYVHVSMSQFARTAGCNRFHLVQQRVARWLLVTSDRAQAPIFEMTQEFLSRMLGVRRVGVTMAASALQARKLIRYKRGMVAIIDRKGLERAACACYRSDRAIYEQFLD